MAVTKADARIALVDLSVNLSETHLKHARENSLFFHFKYEGIKGSLDFLIRFLRGMWDKDFIMLEPCEEGTPELFFKFFSRPF